MQLNAKVDLEPAFVVHRRAYRETSLLLEVFGLHSGRVGLIAKGARRPKSPLRLLLSPFRELLLSWRGRGELGVVTGAEADGPPVVIPAGSLSSGLYVNELLVRLMHRHDPHPELYAQYRETLAAMADPAKVLEQTLRIFEKRLLESVGYGLLLDRVADTGGAVQPGESYCYVHDHGPVAFTEHHQGTRVTGSTLLGLAREQLNDPGCLREAKKLMRNVINFHLEGRDLVSRRLFPSLAARPRTPAANAADASAAASK